MHLILRLYRCFVGSPGFSWYRKNFDFFLDGLLEESLALYCLSSGLVIAVLYVLPPLPHGLVLVVDHAVDLAHALHGHVDPRTLLVELRDPVLERTVCVLLERILRDDEFE